MENKHLSIVGYGKKRAEADFYPTPESTTKALLDREKFEGLVWECASGDGAMAKAIMKYTDNKVFSSDIRPDTFGVSNCDFLKTQNFPNLETKKDWLNNRWMTLLRLRRLWQSQRSLIWV